MIPFHRFLITTAILFCVGFAAWAFVAYRCERCRLRSRLRPRVRRRGRRARLLPEEPQPVSPPMMLQPDMSDDVLSLSMFWAGLLMVFTPIISAGTVILVWRRGRRKPRRRLTIAKAP